MKTRLEYFITRNEEINQRIKKIADDVYLEIVELYKTINFLQDKELYCEFDVSKISDFDDVFDDDEYSRGELIRSFVWVNDELHYTITKIYDNTYPVKNLSFDVLSNIYDSFFVIFENEEKIEKHVVNLNELEKL
jgi:hypothetical protein